MALREAPPSARRQVQDSRSQTRVVSQPCSHDLRGARTSFHRRGIFEVGLAQEAESNRRGTVESRLEQDTGYIPLTAERSGADAATQRRQCSKRRTSTLAPSVLKAAHLDACAVSAQSGPPRSLRHWCSKRPTSKLAPLVLKAARHWASFARRLCKDLKRRFLLAEDDVVSSMSPSLVACRWPKLIPNQSLLGPSTFVDRDLTDVPLIAQRQQPGPRRRHRWRRGRASG